MNTAKNSRIVSILFYPHSQIYEKADVYYAQAVRKRLNSLKADLENTTERTDAQNEQLSVVDKISMELVNPAEKAIRDNPESPDGRILLNEMADKIYPRASVHEQHGASNHAATPNSKLPFSKYH